MKNLIKICLLLALMQMIVSFSFSQSKFRADVSMGLVTPLGDFKRSDINLASSGYATNGFTLNIDGSYYLHKNIAASFKFVFGNSPINNSSIEVWLDNKVSPYLTYPDSAQYRINYWQWASPLAGIKYCYPFKPNKIFVEAGIFSGISINQIPDHDLLYIDNENKRNIVSENIEKNTVSVPFAASAALRFRISSSLELKLESSYFGTTVKYQHVTYIVSENNIEEVGSTDFAIPVKTIDAKIGLVYWL